MLITLSLIVLVEAGSREQGADCLMRELWKEIKPVLEYGDGY